MCNNLKMEAPNDLTEKQSVGNQIGENGNSNVLIDRPTLVISTLPSRICAFSATESIVDDMDNDINNTKNIVIDHLSTVMIHASHTLDLNESLINPTTKHYKYLQQQQHQNLSLVNTNVSSTDPSSLGLTTPDEQIKNESKILLLNHNSKNKNIDFYSPIDNKVNELQSDAVEQSRGKCDADTYYICPERRIINATKNIHRTQNQHHMLHLRTFDDEMSSNHKNNQNHTQYYNNTCTVIEIDDENYSPKIVNEAESLHRSDSELLGPLAIIVQSQADSRDSSSQILSSELGVMETGGENSLETGSYQTLSSVVNEERISPEAFSPNSAYATLTPLQPLPPISTMSEKFAYGGHITGVNNVINNNVTNDQVCRESQRDNINIENHESDYEISNSYVVIPIEKEHTIEHIHRPSARHSTRHDLDSLSLSSLNSEHSPFSAYDKLSTITPHSFITSPSKTLSGVGTNCDLPESRHSPVSDCAAPHSPQLNYRGSNNISVDPLPLSHISLNSSIRQQKLREFHSPLLKTELSSEVNSQNSVEPLSPCNLNKAGEVLLTEYESPFENHNRHNHLQESDIFVNSKGCSSSSICNIISKNCTDSSNLHSQVNSCVESNHSADKKSRICALTQKVLKVPIPKTSNSSPKLNIDVTVGTESKNPINSIPPMLKSAQTKFLQTSKYPSHVDISTGITTIIELGEKNVPNVVKTLNSQNVINIPYQSPHSSDHCDRDVRQSFIPKEIIHSKIKSQVNQLGSIFHNNNNNNNCDIEEINTTELAQRISAELKRYSIPQAVFAQRVLCRSQGTLSDLLRNPKPWSKLKSGRETFRRMLKWLQEPEFQRMSALRIFAAQTTQRSLNIITTKTITTCDKSKNNNSKVNKTNSNKTYKHNNNQFQHDPKNNKNNDICCNNDDGDNNNNYNNYNNNNDNNNNNNNKERIYKDYEGNSSSSLIILNAMDICNRKDQPPQIEHMPQPKKPRLVFTDLQRRTLQAIFKETKRPSKEMQVTIARQLGLEPTTVGNFFMNARRRSMDKWREDDSSGLKKVASDQHQSLQQFNYKHRSGRSMSQKQKQHFHLPCLSLTDITQHHHPLEFNNEPDEVDLNLDSDDFPLSEIRDDGTHKIEDDNLL